MSVVTLSFEGSEEEIVDGIPRYMSIEANIPSTIYFTTDGTTPTTDSPIYTSSFEMPDGTNSVTLSAFGVDSEGTSGPILTQTFAPDVTEISVARNVGLEGFVLSRPDIGEDYKDGFDADGDVARFMDVDLETLDVLRKDRGYLGIAEGTAVEISYPDPDETNYLIDDGFVPFSTPRVGELFNPRARTIVIDNRVQNDIRLVLRGYTSLHDIYREFGGTRLLDPADDAAYVSGGFVRRFYSAEKNVMVSYYFDHNENRYIKNIQDLPSNTVSNAGANFKTTLPLVFPWIAYGSQSGLW